MLCSRGLESEIYRHLINFALSNNVFNCTPYGQVLDLGACRTPRTHPLKGPLARV